MIWVKTFILVLTLISWTLPASAAIDRFTDGKGTIHITNITRAPADQEANASPSGLTSPVIATASAHHEQPRELERPEPAATQEAKPSPLKITREKGVIRLTNISESTGGEASHVVAAPQVIPASAPVADSKTVPKADPIFAASPGPVREPAKQVVGTSVTKYKDGHGVIHIKNAPTPKPNIMLAGWFDPSQPEKSSNPPTREVSGAPGGTRPLLRKVSYSPDMLFSQREIPVLAKAPEVAGKKAGVRHFRDARGVLHIVNGAPRGSPVSPPGQATLAARHTLRSAPWSLEIPAVSRAYAGTWKPDRTGFFLAKNTVLVRKDRQGRTLISNPPPIQAHGEGKDHILQAKTSLRPIVLEAAQVFGLPVSLIEAVIKAESNFSPTAVSPKGAMGLMQLMPGTASFLGVKDPLCPRENILGGCRYLRLLLDLFNQSLPLALAAYNAGYQRVIDADYQVPSIKETQNFVTQVLGAFYLAEKMSLRL